ncbi:TRAP transporter small permease subunit [Allosediminivita pacifica]|uniref:TRAP transporter small permease protein n=1 Tax=Allosediminivita pacifica TaxID=1267769 RepID=A0A2T6ANI7_9RHOB|nr:TRAP transporter small permease [Allosediminivita pacifica]PTX45383.1 TRAP-type C4-dicarboxylate transport system permease small subunit [Allosediminivita pacifica]GGB20854.1 hypothetical protein GCM10011324_33630 [Allosediminivita pacifica]
MTLLKRIVTFLGWFMVLIGGIGLLVSVFLGVADVVGIHFGHPVPGALEITESTMVLIVFGGLTFAQIRRKHIRVEFVYLKMPPRVQSAMDLASSLLSVVFFGLLAWQGWLELDYSLAINESTSGLIRLPLYPARMALLGGTLLMIVQLVVDIVEDISRLARGSGARPEEVELDPDLQAS